MKSIIRPIKMGCLASVLLVASGCGAGGRPQTADSDEARQALHTVLGAWKAGETPAALAGKSPPIQVKDVDWAGGFRLIDYKAQGEGKLVGYDMNYPVVLDLRSPRGVSVKKTAVYTVTTRPGVLVSRQEG